jgi:hypothetical protein
MKHSRLLSLWVVLSLVLLSRTADATDVRVSYLLETKSFKTAVAGTPLTLSLYTNAACAGSPAASVIVNSDALALIEPLKRTTPKHGTKPPDTSRVEHVMSGVTASPLFYLTVTGSGVVPVGGACQVQHAAVNGSDAVLPPPPPPATCAADSVQTAPGQPCVDKYEASLWDIPPGNTMLIQKVKDGTATLADLTGGGATQISAANGPSTADCSPDFPGTFPVDGHYTAPIYAASVAGVEPTACITAYQAAVACQLSGKRLPTGDEWLAAGAGTVDTNTDNGTTDCNTNAPGAGVNAPVNTGSRSACVSTSGTYDQIGNVFEWTLDRTTDVLTGVTSASTSARGGGWGDAAAAALTFGFESPASSSFYYVGFRCTR